jgi:1-acyl-sn-glycerol-3-phosphate acyltransferase
MRFKKNQIKYFFRATVGIVLSFSLFILLLVCNFFQLFTLMLFPFSRKKFRKANRDIADFWWGLASFCLEEIQGIQIHFSGDNVPQKENALLIINHQSMADIPVLFRLGRRALRLGDMKWIGKDMLKYVPGAGWGMLFLDSIFVKRQWHRDRENINRTFQKFFKENIPIWLTTFPEGTRLNKQKLLNSQLFSKKHGLPKNCYVLTPRTKGFVASVQGLRGHITAVYDITIGFPDRAPSLFELVTGKVDNVYVHVRRFEITSLPINDTELSQWLHRTFLEKDQMLAHFHAQGRFI